ncbi:hypothetical protein ONZ45_g11267 [Pleurotus djamor]|nr:hypothetical protein ONZ45_g11267 [Pleurotus djamor]
MHRFTKLLQSTTIIAIDPDLCSGIRIEISISTVTMGYSPLMSARFASFTTMWGLREVAREGLGTLTF